MTTRELIQQEIDVIVEQYLEELYRLVKSFSEARQGQQDKASLMSRIRAIQIDAPEDFAANLDQYLYGDQRE